MSEQKLYLGDCLEILPKIPDSSVDLVLCDLPYGTSVVHKWNKSLPIERLWEQYNRIIKRNGVICLFGTTAVFFFLGMFQSRNVSVYVVLEKGKSDRISECQL